MEQEKTFGDQIPIGKIYKDRAIYVGTFLGGPLVAGYLIAENFKVFNQVHRVMKTWIYSIITTIVIFGGIFLIPESVKIPNQIIPIIYTVIAYYLVQLYQGPKITAHINAGGRIYSWWRTIGVGLIGLAITIIPIFGIAYFSNTATNAVITTKTYSVMKHEIAFDKNNISESEVDKIADSFTKAAFFDQVAKKCVFAKKVEIGRAHV